MSDPANLLGRVVAGKFKIEAPIGAGAMGEVFRARHVVLDTLIALKIMRADIAKDPMFKERFYREAKAASRLDHANSVRVLDYGVEPDGLVYIAMELLHGRDLLSVLRDEWPLPDARIADILVQTLAAVSVAHELGIIHRDLKPENIMVSVGADDDDQRPYHVKVCDFGIAKLSDPRGFQTENSGKVLTSSGTLIGTPEYMSPEQARGDALDPRSDIYSVGIILYQLLVGRVPFSAENALGVVLKQVTDEPVPPTQVRPGVNARLEAICLRALKKSRDERYQSARDMRRDLRAVFGYRPHSMPDESGPHIPAVAPIKVSGGADGADASSAATIVQVANTTQENAVFAPLQTSDGTEVTVPMMGPPRHLAAVIAVAVLALVGGALAFFVLGRTGDTQATPQPSASAAGLVAAANEAPSASFEPLPVTAPLALASASPRHAAPIVKGGPPPLPLAVGRAREPAAASGAALAAASTHAPAASVAPAALPAASDYNPSGAHVSLGAMSHERVREDAMRKKMGEVLPKLSECYRSALMMVGSPVGGSAEIHMSISEKGSITAIVNAPKLPQFARCAQQTLAGQSVSPTALDTPVSAGAVASQWLTLHP
jgi:serine/threonine protein kinase